ncbi:MAG: sigma-54-dependent Fis family transcriptional regulator [Candidatus Marinimicrobia bacterium]|nr:sigma-54-dependent Fis family transcriptional regulator [Candidatus Neomarinimicrobiota bacterium]MCF7827354.1 sigma-54-dependent Fis family transcriptional regulator [Candidatus Neomarinimicrobiota bacterium]MCF7881413.1 sigma-54-dependent Fis family transcriptional regulator [Candidatus Neomarinimicrobiota bacterium]
MPDRTVDYQSFQTLLQERFSELTADFTALEQSLENTAGESELKALHAIYSKLLRTQQEISQQLKRFQAESGNLQETTEWLREEKRRLEVLYSAGITFSAELEVKSLLEKAIDVVVNELDADAGFIILVDQSGRTETVSAYNMLLEDRPDAEEVSRTVILDAMENAEPVTTQDKGSSNRIAAQSSVIRLGISAVMCVPLLHEDMVCGAVYLDRRDKKNPFTERDLSYLLSFAKQIVFGLQTSRRFDQFQQDLLADSTLKFSDLRDQFDCEDIIGSSPKLFEILKLAAKIAPTDAPVVILGESGTGKDLLAQTIHLNSPRSKKAFITIDCGAIPGDLLESELFGYEKGAFTGATQSKPGKLELADGGTVFLNEIGEMPVALQAKLLRIIQTGEVERLGGVETNTIDTRFIAATNKDIPQLVKTGEFREDLYYRLKVFELYMPSLSERKEDITELVDYFLQEFSSDDEPPEISEEVLHLLEEYHWPGNIRELSNVIQRCVVLAKDNKIQVSDLPKEQVKQTKTESYTAPDQSLRDAEESFRRYYIKKTLKRTESKTEAAEILGINRSHLHKLLSQLNITD